jgi:hypothetical protein
MNYTKRSVSSLLIVFVVLLVVTVLYRYQDTTETSEKTEETHVTTPVYVTFAGHIEAGLGYTHCKNYTQKREQLLKFIDLLSSYDIPFNLQASYEWFVGVSTCETPELRATTDGLNLMDFLAMQKNVEIDTHQSGANEALEDVISGNNMADIRYIAGTVTDHITDTAGFQWNNQNQYEEFQHGERGRLYPEFTWYPDILTGAVSTDHANGDFSNDETSIGVWIPSGFSKDKLYLHDTDSNAHMIHIAAGPNQFMNDWGTKPGCHFKSSVDFVELVGEYLKAGRLDSGKIYTYSMFIPQRVMFNESEYHKAEALMKGFARLRDEGDVVFAHFTQVANIWRDIYNSEPSIVTYNVFDPADYTCSPR